MQKRSILVVSWSNPDGWVASIDFGKTVGPIFKIWPVDKVIEKIKFEIIYPYVLSPYWIYNLVI